MKSIIKNKISINIFIYIHYKKIYLILQLIDILCIKKLISIICFIIFK